MNSPEEITRIIREVKQYIVLKEQLATITERQSQLKESLKKAVEEYGEVDGKGHYVLEFKDPIMGVSKITKQKKVSKSLDLEIAEDILAKKQLLDRCLEFIPQLNEQEIMAAFYENLLTEEEIDSMFPPKVSYSFIV